MIEFAIALIDLFKNPLVQLSAILALASFVAKSAHKLIDFMDI